MNRSLISFEGIMHDSCFPNHLYLFLAIIRYMLSLIGFGMTSNRAKIFHGHFSLEDTFRAAVDSTEACSPSTNTKLSVVSGMLCFSNNFCPVSLCSEAKRNSPFASRLMINRTLLLQKLHMPSNKMIPK